MSATIEKVETFIQRLQDLEYKITSEARQIRYKFKQTAYPIPHDPRTLSDCLANAISEYQKRSDNEEERLNYARICYIWINRAFTLGVVQEGEGLVKKYEECREKNTMLENDLEHLSELYVELKRKYEPFEKNFFPMPEDNGLEDET